MELSFCDLRAKEVINVSDGKRLGNVIDMVFETSCARVTGIVVPASRNFFSLFKNNSDIFIPYQRIVKIGKDVVLVEISSMASAASTKEVKEEQVIANDRAAYSDLSLDNVGK